MIEIVIKKKVDLGGGRVFLPGARLKADKIDKHGFAFLEDYKSGLWQWEYELADIDLENK